jgi:hypothetical protein
VADAVCVSNLDRCSVPTLRSERLTTRGVWSLQGVTAGMLGNLAARWPFGADIDTSGPANYCRGTCLGVSLSRGQPPRQWIASSSRVCVGWWRRLCGAFRYRPTSRASA